MTPAEEGDRAIVVPLRGGGRVAIDPGQISVGSRVVLLRDRTGRASVARIASPSLGDTVALYPTQAGGRVCLTPLGGGAVVAVPPLQGFTITTIGPETVLFRITRHPDHTAARIVQRNDRFPTDPEDGELVYEGAQTQILRSIDPLEEYYYSAWGKTNTRYSDEYLTQRVVPVGGVTLPYKIHDGYSWFGQPRHFGPYIFRWDGTGEVLIDANDPKHPRTVSLWGTATAVTKRGSVTVAWGSTSWVYKKFDITPILAPGSNSLRLDIVETQPGWRCGFNSDAWIKQYPLS
jgi:hypothetical protein